MFGWIKRLFSQPKSAPQGQRVVRLRSRYDAAVLTDQHWRNADALSAKSANSLEVRTKLRERARYEVANNCHARGITLTMANDIIGTGPRLQLGYEDDAINQAIENAWERWSTEICLAEKLHTMAISKVVDGESFALFTTNDDLYDSVKLDVKPIECDQVTSQTGILNPFKANWVDGIIFDDNGNPKTYHVLKQHPGDPFVMQWEPESVDARHVLHWFRADRPGMVRGIPEITPALPLFAQLRRYTLAVIEAAECAADFAVVVSTETMPDSDGNPAGQNYLDAFEGTQLDKGMMVTAPAGYRPTQLKPEQPTAQHDAFCKTILKEIFHCLNMPYAVGSGDFADDSYSSGRLGKQTYMRSIKVARHPLNYKILDRVFARWLNEAVMIPDYFGEGVTLPTTEARDIPHQWHFRDEPYVDPLKDAEADAQDIENCTSTLAEKCAERGLDYREVIKQLGKEKKLKIDADIFVDPNPAPPAPQADSDADTADEPAGAAA